MKINLKTVLLLVGVPLILFSPCALAHTDVTAEQARELIDSTDDLIVVDVREPSEYCDTKGHIPGALNYPWYSGVLEAQYGELPMDGPVLVVCGSGSRSNRAADLLDSEGFSMVYDMLSGMRAWTWETEPCVDPDSKYAGGTGEPNDPYQIATAEDLILLGETPEDYDKHFILTADIDLDPNLPGRKVFDRAVIAPDNDPNDAWGDFQGTRFTGVFDGDSHTISHLTIEGFTYLGLFGCVSGPNAQIKNLDLVDPSVDAGRAFSAGCVVGCLEKGTIIACHVEGGSIKAESAVGGLVGSISPASSGARGLPEGVSISISYSTGEVSGSGDVGGLVGRNFYGTVTECYSTGVVSGTVGVGGLVGTNDGAGSITHCYSTGVVSGSQEHIGGLVGYNGGSVNQCYSIGSVSESADWGSVGGLVGHGDTNDVIASFWDMQTSDQSTSAGGIGKTTAEMQTTKTFIDDGWDFVGEAENGTEDIWSICEGTNYPRFVWQIAAGDFVCPDGITIDDFSFFMEHWLDDNCDLSNGYCQGTDLDQSGTVDINDLEILLENWLAEK